MNKNNDTSSNLIYKGFTILCGTLFGVWGFTSNRFNINEIIFIIICGVIVGIALAMIFIGIIKSLK